MRKMHVLLYFPDMQCGWDLNIESKVADYVLNIVTIVFDIFFCMLCFFLCYELHFVYCLLCMVCSGAVRALGPKQSVPDS